MYIQIISNIVFVFRECFQR